ncbi:MAG: hypothetical protein HQM16_07425 [Deltaproteobacteria bacterium]|nr:hypothetical protein [Deltaproteobacteria bacterium]
MTDTLAVTENASPPPYPEWEIDITHYDTSARSADDSQAMGLNTQESLLRASVRLDKITGGLLPPNFKISAGFGLLSVKGLKYAGSIETSVGAFMLDLDSSSKKADGFILGGSISVNILPYYLPEGFDLWGIRADAAVGVRGAALDTSMTVDDMSIETPYDEKPMILSPQERTDFVDAAALGAVIFSAGLKLSREIVSTKGLKIEGGINLAAEYIDLKAAYGLTASGKERLQSIYDAALPGTNLALTASGDINFSDWLFSFGPTLSATFYDQFKVSAGLDVLVNNPENVESDKISQRPVLRPYVSFGVLFD